MNLGKFFYKHSSLLVAVAFLILSNFVNNRVEKPFIQVSKQDSSINVNSKIMLQFNLGLKRLLSSTLWISTILESDIDHYKQKDLNSWMYLRFNSISELEPQFYENYVFGGPYLSIVKDDIDGASVLYKKGLYYYPDDFELLKNAGFHFYFEANDVQTAYPIYDKLRKLKSGLPFVETTLTRMKAAQGDLSDALKILDELQKKNGLNTMIGKKIFENRYAIKTEMDLDCLNSGKKNCDLNDLNGNAYVLRNDKYYAQLEWKPYRPKWRTKSR